jgi:bacillithiol biosynthesis deacetylase BshB1
MIDLLAFGTHPDDVELWAGGMVALAVRAGLSVVIVDLTRGEMASRGTPITREQEALRAAETLGVAERENLGLPDGSIGPTDGKRRLVAATLRRWHPRVVLAPYWQDRHPDHEHAATLIREAAWSSGLVRFQTPAAMDAEPHRPQQILHYMGWVTPPPGLIIDVTPVHEVQLAAIRCFASQLHGSGGPRTRLASKGFEDEWLARRRHFGAQIGVEWGEPYAVPGPLPVTDVRQLFAHEIATLVDET